MLNDNAFASTTGTPLADILNQARLQLMSLTDLFQIAERFNITGQRAAAAEVYKNWVAYNDGNPLLHIAYFNYSVTLRAMGDIAGAIQALQACLKLDPKFGQGYINLGLALEDSGQRVQAIQQWKSYVESTSEITPDRAHHRLLVLQHIGRVLENASLLEEAENTLRQAMELRPDKPEAGQHWTAIRQRQCKWPTLVPSENVTIRNLLDAMSPLTLACFSDDPLFQLAKAYRYNKFLIGSPEQNAFPLRKPRQKSGTAQRLRIGYVSSDLRDHAVGFALSEVLELHDKKSVEIFGYYCGESGPEDATMRRMKANIDHWRDITSVSNQDAAAMIANDEIDILVDVNGYTKHARTKIFAYRPAPVIVNFCGYPGTMGSPFHQYIIADDYIIPPENEIYYTEKVLRIPCDQPVDRKRVIAAKPTRTEAGLPEDSFVFASFNGMQKITAECFARWMQALAATPDSILWLLSGPEDVNQRLRQVAAEHGVAPKRLVFAPKVGNPQHLARIGLADLFLDTFPYGAHSTAADALTMGLPIVTVPGNGFASRFCASIVSSAGIPEMISENPEDYVRKAIALAADRKTLAAIREKLLANKETSVLRDIPALVRRLEELYWQMQGECERGETPAPDLTNLDTYYEVGVEFLANETGWEDSATYRQRYLDKLSKWNTYSPLPQDKRLWKK